MRLKELETSLVTAGIPRDAYSLRGGLPNEAYCISNDGESWSVYYSERGNRNKLKTFRSEEDACKYFFNWLTREVR